MTGYLNAWRVLPRRQIYMLLVLVLAVVLANINQPYPQIAPLQHIPTVLLILAAPPLLVRWPLSDKAVGALLVFWLLHTLGGRYAYSNVPYDAWAHALTGHTVSEVFGLSRNAYDRLVHLAFGLFWVPPYAEAMRRYAGTGRRSSAWTAILFVGAASAFYEVFEWLLTMFVAPEMADDYNGQQGDMWDAQKDMAIAMAGAVVAALWPIRSRSDNALRSAVRSST
jgi:putative membrane protein